MNRPELQSLRDLISFARERSPFYRELYRELPPKVSSIEELPVLRQEDFWEANGLENNRLLTASMRDGIVLKSGGTTGKPKFSVFSRQEWERFTRVFGQGLSRNGLREGDRVANLFYVGELYGSFLFTHKVLEECPTGLLQLPIAGSTPLPAICGILSDFGATILAGLPTTLSSVMEYLETHPELAKRLKLRMLLFAGEAMYPDQRARANRVLPGLEIRSIGYASTDAGLLGFADLSCGPGEFRQQDRFSLYEILDEETGQPLRQPGRAGRAVVTDLHRRLMPVIRYPVGDRALWLEPEGAPFRKFQLLGRAEESARIGPVTLYYEDLRSVLETFRPRIGDFQFQLLLTHRDAKDGLMIRIGTKPAALPSRELSEEIITAIYANRPMYAECQRSGKIHPLVIEWVEAFALEANPRSGKLRRIIDRRLES